MRVRGPNNGAQALAFLSRLKLLYLSFQTPATPANVGRAVQTDPTLLRYASLITERKRCWELLVRKFVRFQTLRNNSYKPTQHVTLNNVVCAWVFAIGRSG